MRLECPMQGPVPREETVRGYEVNKDEYVRSEPKELKALEQASSSQMVLNAGFTGDRDGRRRLEERKMMRRYGMSPCARGSAVATVCHNSQILCP
jgi:non-homologous end joining protein Ku